MPLNPPVPKDWVARYDPQPTDLNTFIRDTFNFLTGVPKLRVKASATQSGIANLTWTTIQLGTVSEDTYSGWTLGASNHYTAQVPGWYGITYVVSAAIAANQVARVGLLYTINGTSIGPFEFNSAESGLNPWSWDCYDEVYLSTGDTITPQFIQQSGSSISTSTTNPSSLEIVWLSR